jgi:hypothetical protein
MMNKPCLIINTVSKNCDLWDMFISQFDKHCLNDLFDKKYVFVDECPREWPPDYTVIKYNKDEVYQQQFVSCIKAVPEEMCVYISEDYILYDTVKHETIKKYMKILDTEPQLSFIRFMKGGIPSVQSPPYRKYANLYEMHHAFPYFYTNQAALWRTRDLEKIHVQGPPLHIAVEEWQNSFEYRATETCKKLDIQGVFCYHGEKKRGIYHYDSKVFPHISTALVKGKWNLSEYPVELPKLLEKYGIDTSIRGEV